MPEPLTAEQVESVMANHVGPHTCQKTWWDGDGECLPRRLATFALDAEARKQRLTQAADDYLSGGTVADLVAAMREASRDA